MPYNIVEHRFRFAAWCAATAAGRSPKCRFPVKLGVEILKQADCCRLAGGWDMLPEVSDFDTFHIGVCERLIYSAERMLKNRPNSNFTYGVAAKMLNCFLKPLFVTGVDSLLSDENRTKRNAIHPPIDRVLLGELSARDVIEKKRFWRNYTQIGWSNFDQDQYFEVIDELRNVCQRKGMWTVEFYWQGYQ